MKKLMTLLILCSLVSLKVYSQNTEDLNLKEINKFLAEGLECKELIKTKNAEIHLLDSSIKVRDAIERNYQGQVREYKRIEEKLTKQNSELVSDNEKKSAEINTQTKRKRIWRNVALSEAGVIVLTALIFLL